MVQIIQVSSVFISVRDGCDLPVSVIKTCGKTAEELRHGKLRLSTAHIRGGIDQDCPAFRIDKEVSAPEIAVNYGTTLGLRNKAVEVFEEFLDPLLFVPVVVM